MSNLSPPNATSVVTLVESDGNEYEIYNEKAGKNQNKSAEANELVYELGNAISYNLDKNSGLSNGDVVTLEVTVDSERAEQLGYKISSFSKTYTVSDLSEPQIADVFDGLTVEFSGVSPDGEAEITSVPTLDFDVYYSLDASENLSNGDIVTVTAEYDNDEAIEAGYVVETTSRTYEVEGLLSYLTDANDITKKNLKPAKEYIKKYELAKTANYAEDDIDIFEFDYKGYYFLTPTSENASYKNILCLVYKFHCKYNENAGLMRGKEYDIYKTFVYRDIMILNNGSLSIEPENFDAYEGTFSFRNGFETKETLFSKAVTAYIDQYDYVSTVK